MLVQSTEVIEFEQAGEYEKVLTGKNTIRTLAQSVANHTRQMPRAIRISIQEYEDEFDHETETWKRLPYTIEQLEWQLECLRTIVEQAVEQSEEA